MKKNYWLIVLGLAGALVACEKEDVNNDSTPELTSDCAYILNQGNYYKGIEGGLSVIDYENMTCSPNVFATVNKRSIGATPQCGVAYGSKIYVGTSESKTIEIFDRNDYTSLKSLQLADRKDGSTPYSMVAYNGKVFISMYDGYLARLDTTSMTIEKSVAVGPNPDQIALFQDKIYVPVSDGMNYPNYGTTACVVNPETMAVENTFTVALNPSVFFATDSHLFLLCKGNYYDVPSALYEVNADLSTTFVCNATLAAAYGDKVAVVDQPWTMDVPKADFKLYDPSSKKLSDWNIEQPEYANQIYYDKVKDRLLIASYVMDGIYPSYDLPGYVNVYDGTTETLIKKITVGAAGPACIFTYQR